MRAVPQKTRSSRGSAGSPRCPSSTYLASVRARVAEEQDLRPDLGQPIQAAPLPEVRTHGGPRRAQRRRRQHRRGRAGVVRDDASDAEKGEPYANRTEEQTVNGGKEDRSEANQRLTAATSMTENDLESSSLLLPIAGLDAVRFHPRPQSGYRRAQLPVRSPDWCC